jgi:hypothetical protein
MNLKKCGNCGSRTGLREIIYGLPEGPLDESKYIIGGCLVGDQDPTHECVECGWQRIPKKKLDWIIEQ